MTRANPKRKPAKAATSQHLWRLTVDAVPALIAYVGTDCRYQMANARYQDWLGVNPDQMPGRHIRDVIGKTDWKKVRPYVDRVLAGETVVFEMERAAAGAASRWIQATYTPDRDATGKVVGFAALVMDITARKQAEAEVLRLAMHVMAEKEQSAALLNSITDEIWFADTAGKFALVNPAGCRAFDLHNGKDLDVRTLAARLEVLRPDGTPRPVEEAPSLRALRGEVVRGQDEMIRTPATGTLRWQQVSATPVRDAAGQIIGSVAVVRDVTAHKHAEERLAASEERFRRMFECHQAVKLVIEPETGAILDANVAACRFYGYPHAQLCSLSIHDLNQFDPAAVTAEMQQAVAEHRNHFEFPHRLADGAVRWVEVYSTLVKTRGRSLLYAIIHDITVRKQTEDALRQSEARLRALGALTDG